jgi:hypothetical protein
MLAISAQVRRLLILSTVTCAAGIAYSYLTAPETAAEPMTPICDCILTAPTVAVPEVEPVVPMTVPAAPVVEHREVTADLVSRVSAPDCGVVAVDTEMVFTDVTADNATLRVLVPCAEMRSLSEGMRYRLALSGPVVDDLAGKNDALWRADAVELVRIHVAHYDFVRR